MGEETKKESAWLRFDNRMGAKHPEIWKIAKWMVVGFIANFPELGAYMLCLEWFQKLGVQNLSIFRFMEKIVPEKEGYFLATVIYAYMISTAIGYAVAFVLNRKATFHADANIVVSTILYVIMVCLIIYVNGVTGPIISSLVGHFPFSESVTEAISKFASMMVAGVWSYPIIRFVIHRKKKVVAE